MITQLTAEQEAQLKVYADKWTAIGLSTDPANRSEAERGIHLAYTLAGKTPPKQIIWCDSPLGLFLVKQVVSHGDSVRDSVRDSVWASVRDSVWDSVWASVRDSVWASVRDSVWASVRDSVRDFVWDSVWDSVWYSVWDSVWYSVWDSVWYSVRASVRDFVYGQHDADWLGFFDYFAHELGLKVQTARAEGNAIIAQNAGWWLPYEDICFISERHNTLHFDDDHQLHCEDGLAAGYPDGWGVYAWHGVRVPEYIILRPDEITPEKIMTERNAEVARVMLERYGQDNFIRDGGFTIQQSDDYGELYRVDFDNGDESIVAVHVQDASTDRDYFLYVPPHIRTAHEGVAWTFGFDNPGEYAPLLET